jgi:hypothetical protein
MWNVQSGKNIKIIQNNIKRLNLIEVNKLFMRRNSWLELFLCFETTNNCKQHAYSKNDKSRTILKTFGIMLDEVVVAYYKVQYRHFL